MPRKNPAPQSSSASSPWSSSADHTTQPPQPVSVPVVSRPPGTRSRVRDPMPSATTTTSTVSLVLVSPWRQVTSTACETSTRLTDRKSTRLNSSHVAISYAVFCLKKKKKYNQDLIGHETIRKLHTHAD